MVCLRNISVDTLHKGDTEDDDDDDNDNYDNDNNNIKITIIINVIVLVKIKIMRSILTQGQKSLTKFRWDNWS